jgi:hypothetical protein
VCESWCLTEELLQWLRVFHAQCLRLRASESRVTRKSTHVGASHLVDAGCQLMQVSCGRRDRLQFYVAPRRRAALPGWDT